MLALDDRTGRSHPLVRDHFDRATASAVLMELALQRRIDNDLHDIFVTDAMPTGDPILDPVLQVMAMAPVLTPKPIHDWLRQLADEGEALRDRALRQLEARGILGRRETKVLGIFGGRRYVLQRQKERHEAILRVLEVILRDDSPVARDIMLVNVANACGLLRPILNDRELAAAAPRIDQVARMDLIGQAMANAGAEIDIAGAMASGSN